MPFYNFRNKETGELFEQLMSISAREQFLTDNPHIESVIAGAPGLSDPARMGVKKTDASFRDLLKNIKRQHIRSTIKAD